MKKIEDQSAPAMRAPMYQVPCTFETLVNMRDQLNDNICVTVGRRASGRVEEDKSWYGRERRQERLRTLYKAQGCLCRVHRS